MMDWDGLREAAQVELESRDLPEEYHKRFRQEVKEINKQGTNVYWVDNYNDGRKWDHNKNGLVFPWLLGMTPVDPVVSGVKHIWEYQKDFPDIDLDFVPDARQTIKDFATEKYVNVCSVGNWVTYKPKSALQDVTRALGGDFREVIAFSKQLPDEFDELTLADHDKFLEQEKDPDPKVRQEAHKEVSRYKPFYDFRSKNGEIVDIAFRLVGKIKAQSTHAGGLIIADRPIDRMVPLSRIKDKLGGYNWTSQWSEGGAKLQMSKFGLIKYDILGLKTMQYIWQAGEFIKQSHGIVIDWRDPDPMSDPPRAGRMIHPDGSEEMILLNDPLALRMCNELRTESVFQIETPIQKGIISEGKVKSFDDLVVYNALGRPGPMDMIPEYIARRDNNPKGWKKGQDSRIVRILDSTFGVICYQEQLTATWMEIAKFTIPEAESSRKVVAKKWQHLLPKVERRWKDGASKVIGEKEAGDWWQKMVTFGRYAFNFAHSAAYSLITYHCLWLKSHFPEEWWAAVMTSCHSKKLPAYMSAARLDNVNFGQLDINNLTHQFAVVEGKVRPGLQSLKGVGEKASIKLTSVKGPFANIDEMVEKCGKAKTVFERLIKLGAFDVIHPNRRGLWMWYQYKYCSGKEITALREEIKSKFAWPVERVEQERQRQADHFKKIYSKRKIPNKILNWLPKIDPTRDEVMGLYDDFDQNEKLKIEKQLLGYYWSSPLSVYKTTGKTIQQSKTSGKMEVVVEDLEQRTSKRGNKYYVLQVTDGIQSVPITVWQNVYDSSDKRCFNEGVGVMVEVDFDDNRNTFKIANDSYLIPLLMVDEFGEEVPGVAPVAQSEEYPVW